MWPVWSGSSSPDNETSHRAILCDHAVRNRLRRREKIFKCVTAVCFAVHEATLIEQPAFIDLGDAERPQVVPASTGGNQCDVGMGSLDWRTPVIWPPLWAELLENCHGAICYLTVINEERSGL